MSTPGLVMRNELRHAATTAASAAATTRATGNSNTTTTAYLPRATSALACVLRDHTRSSDALRRSWGGRVSSERAGQLDVRRSARNDRDRARGVAVVGSAAELGAVSDDGVGPGRELRREPATRTDGCIDSPAVPGGRDQGARDRLVEARWETAALPHGGVDGSQRCGWMAGRS